MEALFVFLIRASVGIVLFYMMYRFFLRNEAFHQANRWFLLGALLLSVVLPLFPLRYAVPAEPANPAIMFQALNDGSKTIETSSSENLEGSTGPVLMNIITIIYGIGAFMVFTRLLIHTAVLVHLLNRCNTTIKGGFRIVENQKYESPFSFFNIIFINPQCIKKSDLPYIISHEKVHIREHHWLDLLLTELLTVIFWFNPFIWFFERSIRQNHEYLADQGVISMGYPEDRYRALLINRAMGVHLIGLTNCLSFSLNKNRLKMMKTKKNSGLRSLKYLLAIPVLAGMLYAFAEPKPVIQENKFINKSEQQTESRETFTLAGKVLDEKDNPIHGVSVVVKGTTTGTITGAQGKFEIEIPQGKELVLSYVGKETIVDELSDIQSTKPVREKYHRRYTMREGVFHINREKHFSKPSVSTEREKKIQQGPSSIEVSGDKKEVFFVVEDMPKFPGGFYALGKYVKEKEEKLSKEHNLTGEAMIGFTVDKKGNVTDIKVLKKDNEAAAKYAVNIVSEMPDWEPGEQRGKPVPVTISLPVVF